MNKQIKWLTAALLISFLISCGKEDEPVVKTKTQLLTQSSWKFQSATASGTDISNNPAIACIKDDVITFSSALTGTVTEGTIVCNPTTASNFTWRFETNETILIMSSGVFPAGSGTFTITELTETSLKISQNVTFGIPPTTAPVTAVYIH
jgi:Lipocalin-like domain